MGVLKKEGYVVFNIGDREGYGMRNYRLFY